MPELDTHTADLLTPEELAAIQAEDSPEERLIMRQGRPEDDGDGDEADDKGESGDAAAANGQVEAGQKDGHATAATQGVADAPAPGESLTGDADTQGDDTPHIRRQPVFQAELPSDYDQQIQDLKSRDAELRRQYKDGEIDIDARDQGLSELAEKREALVVLRTKAEIAQEIEQQAFNRDLKQSLEAILKRATADGVDYRDPKNSATFDRYAKFLSEDPDWADKSVGEIHAEAHKHVLSRLGKAPAVPAKADAPPARTPKETIADAMAKRKPPVADAPRTLAQVPGSDGPGDVTSEFADIDALDGLELEDAIAKMSPAMRAKYMASAR